MNSNKINSISTDGKGNIIIQDVNATNISVNYSDTNALSEIIRKLNKNQVDEIEKIVRAIHEDISEPETEQLDWQNILKKCKYNSQRHLIGIVNQKYIPDLYVNRVLIEDSINKFILSEKVGYILIGNSGMGKTNLLCYLFDIWQKNKNPTLYFNSSSLNGSMKDFSESIRKELGYSNSSVQIENLLYDINKGCDKRNKYFILLIDAINEAINPKALINQINEILSYNNNRIKIIVTSRIQVWKQISVLIQGIINELYFLNEFKPFKLSEFSNTEKETAYNNYKKKYKILTEYHNLSSINKKILSDPYYLKLVSEKYSGAIIPDVININDLFNELITNNIIEKRIKEISKIMYDENKDVLEYDELEKYNIYDKLYFDKLDNSDVTCIQEMLDNNILLEIINDVENEKELRFTYDRYLEYRLSNILKKEIKRTKSIDSIINLLSNKIDTSIDKRFNVLWGALDKTFNYLKNAENEK